MEQEEEDQILLMEDQVGQVEEVHIIMEKVDLELVVKEIQVEKELNNQILVVEEVDQAVLDLQDLVVIPLVVEGIVLADQEHHLQSQVHL